MMIRNEQHYAALRHTIASIGFCEVLEALTEIAQGHADVQVQNQLSPGASKSLAAGLSALAEQYAIERNYEIHKGEV